MAFRNFCNPRSIISCAIFTKIIVYLLLAVLYFLSPFDLIPENVYGVIGFVDDIAIFLIAMVFVGRMIHQALMRNRNA
jgi:RING finger protein 170